MTSKKQNILGLFLSVALIYSLAGTGTATNENLPVAIVTHWISKDPVELGESAKVCAYLKNLRREVSSGRLTIVYRPGPTDSQGNPYEGFRIAPYLSFTLGAYESKWVCGNWDYAGMPITGITDMYAGQPGSYEICSVYDVGSYRNPTYTNCKRFTIVQKKCYYKPMIFPSTAKGISYESGGTYIFWGYKYTCTNGRWTKISTLKINALANKFSCYGTYCFYTRDSNNHINRMYLQEKVKGYNWYYERARGWVRT